MVAHTGWLLDCQEVADRGREELQHRLVLERGRVGHVDDDLGAGQDFGDPFAGNGVDARLRRCRDRLVALLGQPGDHLGADQAAAADHDDLHRVAFLAITSSP
jgi:hypothetical protein